MYFIKKRHEKLIFFFLFRTIKLVHEAEQMKKDIDNHSLLIKEQLKFPLAESHKLMAETCPSTQYKAESSTKFEDKMVFDSVLDSELIADEKLPEPLIPSRSNI